MNKNTAAKVTAQVAVEAIVNEPDGYEIGTMRAVYVTALQVAVAPLYLNMLAAIIDAHEEN